MKISHTLMAFLLLFVCIAPVYGAAAEPVKNINDTLQLPAVVVTGTRTATTTRNLPMSVSVVTERQLEERMEQSVLPLLVERVPSLMITSRGIMGYGASTGAAGGMTMRGVGSSDGGSGGMLMLIDGHPQFMGIFSHPLADTYQTLMAERVEVVRGPASVLYGSNAMGGVINVLTRQQHNDGVNTNLRAMYGSYNTLSTQAVNTTRFGRFNSVASFAYNRSDGHRDNMEYEQYSGYAKAGYDFSTNWKGFVDFNLSKAYSSNPGSEEVPMFDNDMDILRGVASLSLDNSYERTSGALKLFYNFGDHYIDDGYGTGGSPTESRFNSDDWMLGLTLFQNYSLWQGNQTTLGFDYQRFGGHAWTSYLNDTPNNEIAKEYVNDVAAYINFQQLLWKRLMVNAGMRFDDHSVAGHQWIPQLGLSWFAAPRTTVKAIVSKGYRNPSVRELYLWRPANDDLDPERLMNYELSANQRFLNDKLNTELSLYFIKGDNSIVLAPVDNGNGTTSMRFLNTGKIKNYGLEFSADYTITPNLSVNGNYSYLHMKYKVVASPRHKLYIGADYSVAKWTFATGIQYVDDLILNDALATDSFLLWNARALYRATKWLDVFVRGENLTDTNYAYYAGYPMPGATVFGGFSLKL